jgi:hypothetical protein
MPSSHHNYLYEQLITCSLYAAFERRATQCSTPPALAPGRDQTDRSAAALLSVLSVPHAVLRRGDGDGEAAVYMCAVALAESDDCKPTTSLSVFVLPNTSGHQSSWSCQQAKCLLMVYDAFSIQGVMPSRVYDKRLVLFVLACQIQSPLPSRHLSDRIFPYYSIPSHLSSIQQTVLVGM